MKKKLLSPTELKQFRLQQEDQRKLRAAELEAKKLQEENRNKILVSPKELLDPKPTAEVVEEPVVVIEEPKDPIEILRERLEEVANAAAGGGGGGISNYAKYVGTGTPDVNGSTDYSQISWINTTPEFSSGTWSASATGITVPNTGLYLVQVNWYLTGTVVRSNVGIRFAVGTTQQPEIAAHNYIRNTSGHNESSLNLTTTLSLTANDVVSIYAAQLSASGTVSLQGTDSSISITQLA